MVTVTFRRDSRNRLSSVFADGHAGWADAGDDIVCAAASAILQTAWLGLTEYAHVTIEGAWESGRLAIRLAGADRDRDDVRAIVGTAELAIAQFARQFPKHVGIRRERDDAAE